MRGYIGLGTSTLAADRVRRALSSNRSCEMDDAAILTVRDSPPQGPRSTKQSVAKAVLAGLGAGTNHLLRHHQAIEFLALQIAQLLACMPQRDAPLVRVLRHFRRLVVTDMRAERRHQHQGAFQVMLDLGAVRLDPIDA